MFGHVAIDQKEINLLFHHFIGTTMLRAAYVTTMVVLPFSDFNGLYSVYHEEEEVRQPSIPNEYAAIQPGVPM